MFSQFIPRNSRGSSKTRNEKRPKNAHSKLNSPFKLFNFQLYQNKPFGEMSFIFSLPAFFWLWCCLHFVVSSQYFFFRIFSCGNFETVSPMLRQLWNQHLPVPNYETTEHSQCGFLRILWFTWGVHVVIFLCVW